MRKYLIYRKCEQQLCTCSLTNIDLRVPKNECEKTREIDKSDTRVKFNKNGKVSFNVETEKKKIKLKQETQLASMDVHQKQ